VTEETLDLIQFAASEVAETSPRAPQIGRIQAVIFGSDQMVWPRTIERVLAVITRRRSSRESRS
jgi:hypothetical protein